MTASRRRFSQEFKDELCHEVVSTSKQCVEHQQRALVAGRGFECDGGVGERGEA